MERKQAWLEDRARMLMVLILIGEQLNLYGEKVVYIHHTMQISIGWILAVP